MEWAIRSGCDRRMTGIVGARRGSNPQPWLEASTLSIELRAQREAAENNRFFCGVHQGLPSRRRHRLISALSAPEQGSKHVGISQFEPARLVLRVCPARIRSICGQPAGRMQQVEAVDYGPQPSWCSRSPKIDLKPVTVAPGSRTKEQVVASVCGACHTSGTLNAPKTGDAARLGPAHRAGLRRTGQVGNQRQEPDASQRAARPT